MTLQPTVLLHEAYLRLEQTAPGNWSSRTHFLATASCVMRGVLVDYVRERRARKRGGDWDRVSLDWAADTVSDAGIGLSDLIDIDDALKRLASIDERQARIVEMRFFGGLEHEEIAGVLGISLATVKRDWRFARAWLYEAMRGGA